MFNRPPNLTINVLHYEVLTSTFKTDCKCNILTICCVLHISCSVISEEALLKILDLPVLVVLDEAYIEFSGQESRMKWVKQHENLIVLRTFSKRAGMLLIFLLKIESRCIYFDL